MTLVQQREAAPPISDEDDAARAARGDTGAFERLYRRHVARIHSLARRMIDVEEADDVTQEIFARTWDKIGTFRGDAAFGTWLHRLAINVILARRASLAKHRERYRQSEGLMDRRATRPARPDLRLDFESAMGKLPDGARQIFVLHDVEGYKHDEIASMLGISAGTSKSQLHRARMALRDHLER